MFARTRHSGAAVMTYLDELERAFEDHFREVANRRRWVCQSLTEFPSGAHLEFVAGNLRLRLVNERRLLSVEIASVAAPNTRFAVSQVKDHLEPAARGRWNLSLSETVDFLDRHWDFIDREFAADRVDATMRRLSRLGSR